MKFFTPHARDRAKERYGLELTSGEMGGIASACLTGLAAKVRTSERGVIYAWKVGGGYTFPVMKDGVIITFMPPDFMLASHRRRWLKGRYRYQRVPRGLVRAEEEVT